MLTIEPPKHPSDSALSHYTVRVTSSLRKGGTTTTSGCGKIAAQYLRISTAHQQCSLQNQSDAIRAYADRMGFEIVGTYRDVGKSGVVLDHRDGLRQLLNDVVSGTAKYSNILVYDVSRWGRFQDVDEAAHYEFVCKAAGIRIHYCGEQFANDDSPSTSIMKMLKRVMAGEYSRELSVKVHEGAKRTSQAGFRTGGTAGYSLRRLLVTEDRRPKCILFAHDRKSLQSDRVILVPGPDNEVRCVRDIFRMFNEEKMLPSTIAGELTRRGIPYTGVRRKQWYARAVTLVLRHPKYCGCSVFGQSTSRLLARRISNPKDSWIIASGAWQPLVDQATFDLAQKRFEALSNQRTDSELLMGLRRLLRERGMLSQKLVDQSPCVPCSATYARRFGSLSEAFERVGYFGSRLIRAGTRRTVRALRDEVIARIVAANPRRVERIQPDGHFRPRLRIGRSLISVLVCRCLEHGEGDFRWVLGPIVGEPSRIALVIRLNPGNRSVMDLFVVPDTKPHSSYALKIDDPRLRRGIRLSCIADFSSVIDLIKP